MQTRSKLFSSRAWTKAMEAMENGDCDKFITRARSFPALIHNAGACQAYSFSLAKDGAGAENAYIEALKYTAGPEYDFSKINTCPLETYMSLSDLMMDAAQWLKTSVDALAPEDKNETL